MKFARTAVMAMVLSSLALVTGALPAEAVAVQPQSGANLSPQSLSTSLGLPAVELATGSRLACALSPQSDGSKVYCWGSTFYGSVGNGVVGSGQVNFPTLVVDGSEGFSNSGVTTIDAAGANACALKGGSVYCWGLNDFGQLGNGLAATMSAPVKVADGVAGATPRFVNANVTSIAVGGDVICAVRSIPGSGVGTGDHLYCWGKNSQGQLGTLSSSSSNTCNQQYGGFACEKKPVLVTPTADLPNDGTESITDISVGSGIGCAITGGQLACWGIQNQGNLGRTGSNDGTSYLAANVTANDGFLNTNVSSVSASFYNTCAIESGTAYCWGDNEQGTVGIGSASSNAERIPRKVVNNPASGFVNTAVTAIDVESGQGPTTCAIAGGVAFCWGADGVDSQFTSILGVTGPDLCGSDQCAWKPVKVSDGEMTNSLLASGTRSIQVGPEFVCAIKSEVPYCWGADGEGQLGLAGYGPDQSASPPEYYQNPWMVVKTSKPTVTAISPTSFGLNSTITLTGTNLSTSTQVWVGSSSSSGRNNCVVQTATGTSLTCTFGSTVPTVNQLTVRNLRALEAWNWGQAPTYTWTGGTAGGGGSGGGGSGGGGSTPTCTPGAGSSSASNVTVDPSFGTSGVFSPSVTNSYVDFMDAVVGSDGKGYLLANVQASGSGSNSGNNTSRIYRFNVDGSVDTTWGSNGFVEIDVVTGNSAQGREFHTEIAQLSDGSLVLAGRSAIGSMSSETEELYVVRVTSAGIDTSWGNGGRVTVAGPRSAGTTGSYPDDLVLGAAGSVLMSVSSVDQSTQSSILSVFKVTAAGAKDASFAGSGELSVSAADDMVSDSTGAIYLMGHTATTPRDASIRKFDANGVAVSSFGTGGQLVVNRSTSNESFGVATIANDKMYVVHRESPSGGSGPMNNKTSVGRFDLSGTLDSSYASSGYSTVFETGSFYPFDLTALADGSMLLVGNSMGDARLVSVGASGAVPSPMVQNGATFSSGTCAVDYGRVFVMGGSFYLYGGGYTGSASLPMVFKFAVAGVTPSTGGGSAPSTPTPSTPTPGAPTLVTSENQSLLEREPGGQGMIVNGQAVEVETTRVEISAARTPASQRTPSQVAAIQAAGQALLQEFIASLPPGATTNVTVVNTSTGAVMQNLVFDANGNSVDVPVEDILILDGPSLSMMLGADNATISSDGKFIVGVGATVGVVGAGFGSNASGELVVMSTPTLVDTFTATASGEVSASAALPESIGVGDHTLVAATNGIYAVIGLRVVPTSLPATGVDGGASTLIVFGLFVAVMAAVVTRSRRLLVVR